MILNHALKMHFNGRLHISLNLFQGITDSYATREIRRISAIVLIPFFDNDKETIHVISSSLEVLLV